MKLTVPVALGGLLRRPAIEISASAPPESPASLKVVDRLRLNQRSTLYRVRFDGHEFWIAQCGDKLVQLDPNLSAHPTAGGLE
ncbi:MAG TPA: hypothetical protein PKL28_09950 [Rhodocyclaceae bacterium]|nr:hypothetical protein [Rhodocyclaceae bacterium]HNE44256.1 hypothetical protein [Rhodocyclaceae bacterium]HNL21303.1 hypothetical protein [Rhodocyclaceae bacterium]HNM81371.1 hypothetical protein [Rhodocyclaceae bacterium]